MRLHYSLITTHHLLSDVLPNTVFTTINCLTLMSFPDAVTFLKHSYLLIYSCNYLFLYYIQLYQLVIVQGFHDEGIRLNPLNAELNPICYLLALLAHHFLHVSRISVKSLTLRLLMSYIYIWSTHS